MRTNFSGVDRRHGGLLLGLALAAMVLTVPARADVLTTGSSINESGDATITATSLTFCNSGTEVGGICPGTTGSTSWVVPASATGSFCLTPSASCTGPTGNYDYQTDSVTMTNLNNSNAPVGMLLPGDGIVFVTFNPTGGLPSPPIELWLTEVFAGAGDAANCATGIGECTPTSTSSVTLINTGANTSSATISAMGLAESESGQFYSMSIVLTSQFGENLQAVLAGLASNSSVTNSYSGTFTVVSPEPMTPLLMGFGLLALTFVLRRRRHA